MKPNTHTSSPDTVYFGKDIPITLSTRIILQTAEKLGVEWKEIPGTKMFSLTHEGVVKIFTDQMSPDTNFIGWLACNDKVAAKAFLQQSGISVAKGAVIYSGYSDEDVQNVLSTISFPVVVKPTNGKHGKDVFVNIKNTEEMKTAIKKILDGSEASLDGVLIENMFTGHEYRILATREKVIGIINRVPANVVGDGTNTIQQLIDLKNADPRRGDGYDKALLKIKVDSVVTSYLAQQQMNLDFVPASGMQVFLRENSNLSTGGDSIDFTDKAHPSVAEVALRAINAIPGLAFAGIDFMTPDIYAPQTENSYIIVEINASPMLSMHDFPYEGKSRMAADSFIYSVFPELSNNKL